MLAHCSACSPPPGAQAQDAAPGVTPGWLGRGSRSPRAPLDGLAAEAGHPGPLWTAWPRKPVARGPSGRLGHGSRSPGAPLDGLATEAGHPGPLGRVALPPCVVPQHEWPASSVLLYTVCSLGCFRARCVSKSRFSPDGSVQPPRGWVQGAVPLSCLETAACHSITKTGLWGTRAQVDCVVVFLRSLGMFLRGS